MFYYKFVNWDVKPAGLHQYAKEISVLNEALQYLTESDNEK